MTPPLLVRLSRATIGLRVLQARVWLTTRNRLVAEAEWNGSYEPGLCHGCAPGEPVAQGS